MAAHARSNEHDGVRNEGHGSDEFFDSLARIIHAAIIHRLHSASQIPHHGRHGGDFPAPGAAFFAVRKHDGSQHNTSNHAVNVKETPLISR